MSNASENEIIAGRWFTDFWGKSCNLGIVDELATPDMLLQYSLHEPRRGHADIKAFMTGLREAFPDLAFCAHGGPHEAERAVGHHYEKRWLTFGVYSVTSTITIWRSIRNSLLRLISWPLWAMRRVRKSIRP